MSVSSDVCAVQFAQDVEEALALLGPIMRPQNPALLRQEYPLVYGMPGRGGVRVLKKEGQAVAGAAFVAFDAITDPPTGLRVGAIGSVGTHPDHRGRGYAGEVLRECEEALKSQGCALSILWSQVPEVFRKNGYVESGTELDYVLFPEDLGKLTASPGVVVPFEPDKDLEAGLALYRGHPARVERGAEEFSRLADIPGMKLLVHRHLGRVTAYAAFGKGTDFPRTFHEWGGDPAGVFAIVRFCLMQDQEASLTLIASEADRGVVEFLAAAGSQPFSGFLGMLKVIDRDELSERVAPVLERDFGVAILEGRNGFSLGTSQGRMDLEDPRFLKLLFGYKGIAGEALEATGSLGSTRFRERVPLRMFLWGLDSI